MASEHFSHIGSGTVPFIGSLNPSLSGAFPQGRYPAVVAEGVLFDRKGTGSIVLNFEDMSVFLGVAGSNLSITSSATPIPTNPLVSRRTIAIANLGPGTLYIGPSNVSTANGFPLAVNEKIAIACQGNNNVTIYGVSDSTSDVRYIELA